MRCERALPPRTPPAGGAIPCTRDVSDCGRCGSKALQDGCHTATDDPFADVQIAVDAGILRKPNRRSMRVFPRSLSRRLAQRVCPGLRHRHADTGYVTLGPSSQSLETPSASDFARSSHIGFPTASGLERSRGAAPLSRSRPRAPDQKPRPPWCPDQATGSARKCSSRACWALFRPSPGSRRRRSSQLAR